MAAILNEFLSTALNNIQTKRIDDGKWIRLAADGTFELTDRANNCWTRVVEWFKRIFTNETLQLSVAITNLSIQVERYLTIENESGKRSAFLYKYTGAINEIFRCAAKMRNAGMKGFASVPNPEQLPHLNNWVIAPQNRRIMTAAKNEQGAYHGLRVYHPYLATGEIFFANTCPEGTIHYTLSQPDIFEETTIAVDPDNTESVPIESRLNGDKYQVSAQLSTTRRVPIQKQKNYEILVRSPNDFVAIEREENSQDPICMQITIRNLCKQNISIKIDGLNSGNYKIDQCSYDSKVNLAPDEIEEITLNKELPPEEPKLNDIERGTLIRVIPDGLDLFQPTPDLTQLEITCTTQKRTIEFSPGCKNGEYIFTSDQNGKLRMAVHAKLFADEEDGLP